MGSACAQEGGGVKAFFDADAVNDVHGMLAAIDALCDTDKLRVILFIGGGSLKQFGFRAEVGRA
jgi:hypothetical protein